MGTSSKSLVSGIVGPLEPSSSARLTSVVYMRKVKFTQDTFDEKVGRIISEFPILDVRAFLSG